MDANASASVWLSVYLTCGNGYLLRKLQRMGAWSFVRYMRIMGVPFDTALFICTGRRAPRI